ncbi:unnamed protein product, partial [Polarella glacialis]
MAIELETFLGEWRDSLGNLVEVDWAKPGSRGGQLNVLLSKPRSNRDPIRLDVKSVGRGRFVCGHYDLDLEDSNTYRIVWADSRNRGKNSVWQREGAARESSRGGGDYGRESRSGGSRASGSEASFHDTRPPGSWVGAGSSITPSWSASHGLPSPAAYWATAAGGPGSWAPLPAPRSAAASAAPTPGAWVPPPLTSVPTGGGPSLLESAPAAYALTNGSSGHELVEELAGGSSQPEWRISRPAPAATSRPTPLVDEMEEFDRMLLLSEAGPSPASTSPAAPPWAAPVGPSPANTSPAVPLWEAQAGPSPTSFAPEAGAGLGATVFGGSAASAGLGAAVIGSSAAVAPSPTAPEPEVKLSVESLAAPEVSAPATGASSAVSAPAKVASSADPRRRQPEPAVSEAPANAATPSAASRDPRKK